MINAARTTGYQLEKLAVRREGSGEAKSTRREGSGANATGRGSELLPQDRDISGSERQRLGER